MGVVLRSGICIPPLPQSRAEEVEWLPGLSQSFRTKSFDKVKFDSKIYFYGEDVDVSLRVREFGIRFLLIISVNLVIEIRFQHQ